jgi:hypothetical protein
MRMVLGALGATFLVGSAHGETLQVPATHPTLGAAVRAAAPGDRIEVQGGRHCGARLDKPLTVVGRDAATIIGCPDGPAIHGGLKVGFLLDGEPASPGPNGTRITGFTFDGADVATERHRLAFGIFGRFTSDVVVADNTFSGTVQAITNTAGSGWVITRNRIRALSVFNGGGRSGGGVGIVVQSAGPALAAPGGALNPLNRPRDNTVAENEIEAHVPDGLDAFSMAGILVLAADGTVVSRNHLRLPDNAAARGAGEGVLVTSRIAARPHCEAPGARDTVVEENDGRDSELAVLIENPGVASTDGLEIRDNRGAVVVEKP